MKPTGPPSAMIRNSCDDAGPVVTLTNPSRKPRTFLVTWYGPDATPHPEPWTVLGGSLPIDVVLTVPEHELVEVEVTLGTSLLASLSLTRDCTPEEEPPDDEHHALWSDPLSWHDGVVPGPDDVAHIDHCIILDTDARVAGAHIEGPEGWLIFEPGSKLTLESSGNVEVMGKLTMRPASPDVVHTLRFVDIDEQAFVGGGMEVLDTDVGLWVMGDGVLDLEGSAKTAWTNGVGAFVAGGPFTPWTPELDSWRLGDDIVITPTGALDAGYDRFIYGDGSPLAYSHPPVEVAPGRWMSPEVINLTRNVVIEGQPGQRSHVMCMSNGPQTIRNVELRHLGPRKNTDDGKTTFVLGRWGLHFHMMGEASRGSLVEGVVAHDCGAHVFVTHLSHGVTYRDCVSHDSIGSPFWWDTKKETIENLAPPTNDVLYERCVASLARLGDEPDNQHHAFLMGFGVGNRAVGCVAVGVDASSGGGGAYLWTTRSQANWTFEDCVAHNCGDSGIRFWSNGRGQVVERFVAYHCGRHGIMGGAYRNDFQYIDCLLYGNGEGQFHAAALSKEDSPIRLIGCVLDGAGVADYALEMGGHQQATILPIYVTGSTLRGGKVASIGLGDTKGQAPHMLELVGCDVAEPVFMAEAGATGFVIVDGQEVWRA